MGLCVVFVRGPGYPGDWSLCNRCDYIQGCSLVVLGICVRRWVMVFWDIYVGMVPSHWLCAFLYFL